MNRWWANITEEEFQNLTPEQYDEYVREIDEAVAADIDGILNLN